MNKCERCSAPTDEALDRISHALGLGAPAAPVDDMVTEIGRLRDESRARFHESTALDRGRWFVDKLRRYFEADLRVKAATSPRAALPEIETRERLADELRKAVMG